MSEETPEGMFIETIIGYNGRIPKAGWGLVIEKDGQRIVAPLRHMEKIEFNDEDAYEASIMRVTYEGVDYSIYLDWDGMTELDQEILDNIIDPE